MRPRVGRRLLLALGLVGASFAAIVGGTAVGAATAPTALPDAATIQQETLRRDPPESAAAAPRSTPQLRSTMGVVVRVAERRFAIATKEGRRVVGVRPMTTIMVDGRKASLDQIKQGDVVLVLGRTGPRGNYIARAVRVGERA